MSRIKLELQARAIGEFSTALEFVVKGLARLAAGSEIAELTNREPEIVQALREAWQAMGAADARLRVLKECMTTAHLSEQAAQAKGGRYDG